MTKYRITLIANEFVFGVKSMFKIAVKSAINAQCPFHLKQNAISL